MDSWEVAEEISKIDGLGASPFLKRLIEEEKNGIITTEEMVDAIIKYYGEK